MSFMAHSLSRNDVVMSRPCFANHSLRICSPWRLVSFSSLLSCACIFPLAFAVETKFSHSGEMCCAFDVRISTWSPDCSLWLSGTSLWFTFAPMQWLPRKECMLYAKSSAVHPAGIVKMSPFGVKTNISLAKRFSFIASRKSMASGCGSSRISFIVRSQSLSSLSRSSSELPEPSLYFQCAAKPCSATSSMWSERICTSIQRPVCDISVTCNA